MKKNKFITKLVLSCLTCSAALLLSNPAFATATEGTTTSEKIIAETSQTLSTVKEKQQKLSEQKDEKNNQLAVLGEKIKKIQINLEQLDKIKSMGSASESTENVENHTMNLPLKFSSNLTKNNKPINTLDNKKTQLMELKQQQETLKTETETISKQQTMANEQEIQLSEKIVQVKKQQTEQVKQADTRSIVVAAAKKQLGKPYVYGAAGPDSFDCSGLVQVAFASAGHSLGRTTIDQELAGSTIAVSEAQAGDLVFWGSHGSTYHVGISTGDGAYIHAPVPGDVVQISTVSSYSPDFAVRVL